jgi:hypothetical protein
MDILSTYITQILVSLTQMQERNFWIKSLAETKILIEDFESWIPLINSEELLSLQLNQQINPIYRFDKEIFDIVEKPKNWLWFKKENQSLKNRNLLNLNNIFFFKLNTLKRFYSRSILEKTLQTIKLKKIKDKKIKITQILNLNSFKLILKDLLIQTWEKISCNIISNLFFRYSFILQKRNITFLMSYSNSNVQGRLNFEHLRWFLKNF